MKYIIGNWKMNLSLKEAEILTLGIIQFLRETPASSLLCMIAPPFPFLERLHTLISREKTLLSLGSQDISAHEKGAFTGEVSGSHLKEVGVKASLIGHSERRLYAHETEPILRQKTLQCLSNGLIPILCLGESLEIRRASRTIPFVLNQLYAMCEDLQERINTSTSPRPPLMIAYEPLWAIGTGCIPSLEEIEDVHKSLSIALKTLFPRHAIPILYGGSVTPLNSSEILALPHVDGALVGGASLSLETFLPLLKNASFISQINLTKEFLTKMTFLSSHLKNKLVFLYLFSTLALSLPHITQAYQSLMTSEGAPSPLLRELFQALNLPSESLIEMNAIAQREFLRKAGEERWHMKEVSYEKEKILPILEKLGVIHEALPSPQMYESVDYIFIHGARVSRMQDRVNFFLTKVWPKLSEQRKKSVKIVFLTGDRQLDINSNEKEDLLNPNISKVHFRPDWKKPTTRIETENDAAQIICDQMISDKFLRDKILFVSALQTKDGKRPTTKDTINRWLKSFEDFHKNPNSVSSEYRSFWKNAPDLYKSKILAISNNPFIPYQDQAFKNTLTKEGFESTYLETVGPEADPKTLTAVHLDNIARWLYESIGSLKKEK